MSKRRFYNENEPLQIGVKLTTDEYNKLRSRSFKAEMSMSQFIRTKTLK